MRGRRLWPLLLVVGVLVGGRLFLRRAHDVTVVVEVPSPVPDKVELLFVRADDKQVVRDVTLALAAAHVERAVRLPEGSYEVTAQLGGRTVVRPLVIDGDGDGDGGRYVLDLR